MASQQETAAKEAVEAEAVESCSGAEELGGDGGRGVDAERGGEKEEVELITSH